MLQAVRALTNIITFLLRTKYSTLQNNVFDARHSLLGSENECLHLLQLLKVRRHVSREYHFDDERAECPAEHTQIRNMNGHRVSLDSSREFDAVARALLYCTVLYRALSGSLVLLRFERRQNVQVVVLKQTEHRAHVMVLENGAIVVQQSEFGSENTDCSSYSTVH